MYSDTKTIRGYVLISYQPLEKRAMQDAQEVVDSTELPEDQVCEILARFDEAQSLLSVCHRTLALNEAPNAPFDEAMVLADAINKFRVVRNEIDEFAMALPRIGKTP